MTDTHVGKTKESCSRARLAYEMFRDMGVDLIANVGDVADHHYPTGYVAYREMVDETFAQVPAVRRPKELFVYAWHDAYAYKNHPREDATKDSPEAFADMQRLIGATNGPYAEGEIKGYPYVVIPQLYGVQGVDWRRFDKMLADAVASRKSIRHRYHADSQLCSNVKHFNTVFHMSPRLDLRLVTKLIILQTQIK
jgi:hypothetical protein